MRICTFLHLSRDHLLDVTVMCPFTRLDGFQATLEQGHRIRSLRVSEIWWRTGIGRIDIHKIFQCLQQSPTSDLTERKEERGLCQIAKSPFAMQMFSGTLHPRFIRDI